MNEFYWITRFDTIHNWTTGLCIASLIVGIIAGCAIIAISVDGSENRDDIRILYGAKKLFKIAFIDFILWGIPSVFVPTTKDALIIYGVGGAIDYIKSDSTAKQLPKKAILALDKYLNEITDDKN